MSVGFRPPEAPLPPPLEHLMWRLTKDVRVAEARVRMLPHGRELRIVVGDTLFWSRLYRDHEDSREIGAMATGCRQDVERCGWQLAAGDAPNRRGVQ